MIFYFDEIFVHYQVCLLALQNRYYNEFSAVFFLVIVTVPPTTAAPTGPVRDTSEYIFSSSLLHTILQGKS